jgi:hypothetical protein
MDGTVVITNLGGVLARLLAERAIDDIGARP